MRLSSRAILSVVLSVLVAAEGRVVRAQAGEAYWASEMARVHARFSGEKGTFAHFGDSITVTLAYWTPLLYARKNASPEMEGAFVLVKEYLKPACWRDWKGAQFGNEGGMTIRWAHENIGTWLKRLKPEVALIMFGTNDLNSVPLAEYKVKSRQVVRQCLDNGTIIILSTIPPRHGLVEKSASYAEAVREIAHDMKVPLIDFHAEILKRRGDDWDGAMEKFAGYEGYNVPTLLARDGVHPSNPKQYQNDYSIEGLRCSGYALRNYLSLMKYAEVLKALDMVSPGKVNAEKQEADPGVLINPPRQPWFPKAPPLGKPQGEVVEVSNVPELIKALGQVKPGGTIFLADGHYMMPHFIEVKTDGVWLRGKSGLPERVVIDGAESRDGELIWITSCSGVTIADLTIQNIKWNGFKINSETNVQGLTIRNCIIHNIWQRGVKGVKVPKAERERIRPKRCKVQYCLFYNDRPKRLSDDAHDIAGGNYIGGIDVMYPADWVISDNVFVGLNGSTREARGAIFIWHDARDCIIERNIIINCDAGICLGNPHRDAETTVHCTGFVVRNNFVTNATEGGIVPVYTKDCKILNNTIYERDSRLGRLIRVVFDNDGLVIANNLVSGPPIRNESDSKITFLNNLEKDISSSFVDAAQGNLHLARRHDEVVGRGLRLKEVRTDIDGRHRGETCDIGADEWED
ncbi:MAG: right-handed parallel beta-helix repeat-containing protein [Sedimentisphaerales bacterium]|nr:right-handed parallel beta-helix repeat-containing protein [Sedimentisphaerales bacterium]